MYQKMYQVFPLVLCLLGSYISTVSAQQLAVIDLVNQSTPAQHEICIQPNSELTNAEATEDELLMYRLEADEEGSATFEIDNFTTTDASPINVKLSLIDEDNPTTEFTFWLTDDTYDLIVGSSTISLNTSYNNGDIFKIERLSDKIFFYQGNTKLTQEGTVSATTKLIVKVEVLSAQLLGSQIPRLTVNFPIFIDQKYVKVKKKLDAGYVDVKDNLVRFYYSEKYAKTTNLNDNIDWEVIDWQNSIKESGSIVNDYGDNWKEIQLSASFSDGDFYTLKIKGANKNEVYYMRFLYHCPPGISCP